MAKEYEVLLLVNSGEPTSVLVGDETYTIPTGRNDVSKLFPEEAPKVEEPPRADVPSCVTPYQYDTARAAARQNKGVWLDLVEEQKGKPEVEIPEAQPPVVDAPASRVERVERVQPRKLARRRGR